MVRLRCGQRAALLARGVASMVLPARDAAKHLVAGAIGRCYYERYRGARLKNMGNVKCMLLLTNYFEGRLTIVGWL